MITAVDSNVLIDIFRPDPEFGPLSADALRKASAAGGLIACDVVWAEVAVGFDDHASVERAMDVLGISLDALDAQASTEAGRMWVRYRRRSRVRDRIVPDFLIGAHAMRRADRLLTRDRGFYRRYFAELRVLDPRGEQ